MSTGQKSLMVLKTIAGYAGDAFDVAKARFDDESDVVIIAPDYLLGRRHRLRKYLREGNDPDKRFEDGKTLLMFAAEQGKTWAGKMLLKYGASWDAEDKNNLNALAYAYDRDPKLYDYMWPKICAEFHGFHQAEMFDAYAPD